MRAAVPLAAIGAAAVVVLIGAPLLGLAPVLRLPAVLVPALALSVAATRPWRSADFAQRVADWQPSTRLSLFGALVAFLFLFWYVLTRFQSGQINAIDFTVYYDRPCFQTVNGRPLFVEVSDTPGLSFRSELGDHAYWGMLAVCSLYAVHPSPLWLHGVSAAAIALGAVFVLRVLLRRGAGGALACAGALAFVLNDNTARALNYGFHPEVLYACFVPWMLDAGLRGARRSFLVAALLCVLVKEDAILPMLASSVALALHRFSNTSTRDRMLYLVLPSALALANLTGYYGYVLPFLTGDTSPPYAHFWGNYGATPARALAAMATQPLRVIEDAMGSGIFGVLAPHLFLPVIGWRFTLGVLPIVAVYGASANEQVKAFGIYYAIPLVPFLTLGAASGALLLCRRLFAKPGHAQLAAASVVLLGALLVGSGSRGYSLRPWKAEIAAVPEAVARLAGEPLVLVQSGLFPHAGYDERLRLLTRETLDSPRYAGAALLLAPGIGAYPFDAGEVERLSTLPPLGPMPSRLLAVRLPAAGAPRGQAAGSGPQPR